MKKVRVVKEIHIGITQIHYSLTNKAPAYVLYLCFFFSGKLNKNFLGTKSEVINSLNSEAH